MEILKNHRDVLGISKRNLWRVAFVLALLFAWAQSIRVAYQAGLNNTLEEIRQLTPEQRSRI